MAFLLFILILGLIITVHEYGHFIVARKNGIVVEEFAVGMGPLIYGKKKGDTLYSIRLLPIGGYCKMLGIEEKSDDEEAFNNKNVFRRMAVIAAGSIFNIVLSFLLVIIILSFTGFTSLTVNSVHEDYPAYAAGLQQGDRIVRINGARTYVFHNVVMALNIGQGQPMDVVVNRGGTPVEMNLTPMQQTNNGSHSYVMGFSAVSYSGMLATPIENMQRANIFNTLQYGLGTVVHYIRSVVMTLVQLVTFNIQLNDLAGPVGIVSIIGDTYDAAIEYSVGVAVLQMMTLAALLSANVALFNLLPIPALDGGRLIFLIIEAIRGKPISPEKEGMVHVVGFALLIGLIIVVSFNDILRLFR